MPSARGYSISTAGGPLYFAIKKPGGKRKSFAVQRVDGKKRTTVSTPELETVNRLLHAGSLSLPEAHKQVTALVAEMYEARDRANPQLFHADNIRIVAAYWDAEYADRDIIKPEARRRDIEWAVAGLGSLSIMAADKKKLQQAVDTYFDTPGRQRRAVARINQLLIWQARGFTLRKQRELHRQVSYLTLPEFETVLPHIKDPKFAIMCKAAFVTGCRAGELFPLTPAESRGASVWVATQLDREGETRQTKNRKERRAFVIRERRDWLAEWLALENREELRTRDHSDMLKAACALAFPDNKKKHVVFHALRHSYAIYLLQTKGASIQTVANCLGNSVTVCEKYYAGFVLTDPGLDYLERL